MNPHIVRLLYILIFQKLNRYQCPFMVKIGSKPSLVFSPSKWYAITVNSLIFIKFCALIDIRINFIESKSDVERMLCVRMSEYLGAFFPLAYSLSSKNSMTYLFYMYMTVIYRQRLVKNTYLKLQAIVSSIHRVLLYSKQVTRR